MTDGVPWDAGLQPERTSLAWSRLGLALIAIGLGMGKATFGILSWASLPAAIVATVTGAGLLVFGRRRYARTTTSLRASGVLALGGRLPLAATIVTLALAATALAAMVLGWG